MTIMVVPVLNYHNDVISPLFDPAEGYKKVHSLWLLLLEKVIFACNHLVNFKFLRFKKSHRWYLFIYNYMELLLC